MIDDAVAKGATPIISGQTPNDPYEKSSTIINSPARVRYTHNYILLFDDSFQFVGYAKNIAAKKNVPYVDHFQSCILSYTVSTLV